MGIKVQSPLGDTYSDTPSLLMPTRKMKTMPEEITMSEEVVKNCQFCGEEVLAVAKKCKHCASMLDDEAQTGDESSAVESDGNLSWWQIVLGLGFGVGMVWMTATGSGSKSGPLLGTKEAKCIEYAELYTVSMGGIKGDPAYILMVNDIAQTCVEGSYPGSHVDTMIRKLKR